MRIATAFFLLIVFVLVVFGLCGYLMKEVDATQDLLTNERNNTAACQREYTTLKSELATLQSAYQSNMDAYKDLKAKYYMLLSSPFTTRDSTPAVMAGSLLFGSIATMVFTRVRKSSNPASHAQIVTRQGARNHQITITMNAQTYANFQKYLQSPNK